MRDTFNTKAVINAFPVMPQLITLPMICREAGISDATGRRYFADVNPYRDPGDWHRFTPEEKSLALALIEAKQKRKCRNAHNSRLIEEVNNHRS